MSNGCNEKLQLCIHNTLWGSQGVWVPLYLGLSLLLRHNVPVLGCDVMTGWHQLGLEWRMKTLIVQNTLASIPHAITTVCLFCLHTQLEEQPVVQPNKNTWILTHSSGWTENASLHGCKKQCESASYSLVDAFYNHCMEYIGSYIYTHKHINFM